MIISILSKNIKDAQEIALINKFVRQLSVFKQREELFDSASLSNKIIQSLRSVFVPKHKALFKYGDRGNEYYIMLSGQAFCLIPYTNMIPQDQINKQIDERLNTQNTQTSEEELDEDFLLKNYSRCQCVKIYQPGEAFGEIALLTTESKRMASIVCKQDSWFISLDREGYNSIQGSYQQHLLNEKVHFLKSFAMFEPIVVNKMLSFLHEMKEQVYERGQFIYSEKKNPLKNEKIRNKVYFLMNGDIDLVTYNYHNNNNILDSTQQPIIKHFRNTKVKLKEKVVVSLSGGSYFGDEQINGNKMSLAAVCRSQTCKLLSVDSVKLLQFLTVYETDKLFLNMAMTKQECLTELLQGDILQQNNLQVNEMYAEMAKKKQLKELQVIKEQRMNGIKKDDLEDIRGDGGGKKKQLQKKLSMKKKNDEHDTKEERILTIQQSNLAENKVNSQLQDRKDKGGSESETNMKQTQSKDPSTMVEFPRMSKFKNVYQLGQQIPKANELKLQKTNWELNDSSCKFNLEDVPMTTTMNRDQAVLDRLHIRLSKIYPSLCSDSNNLKMPSIMQLQQNNSISRHNSSIFKATHSSKDTVNLNISEIPIIPSIHQSSNSQTCFSSSFQSHHKMSHSVFLPPLRLAEISDIYTPRNSNSNPLLKQLQQLHSPSATPFNLSSVIMNQSNFLTNSQIFSHSPIQSPKVTCSNFPTQLPKKQKPTLSHQNSLQLQQEQQLNSKRSQISSSQYQEQIFNKLLAASASGKNNHMRIYSIH